MVAPSRGSGSSSSAAAAAAAAAARRAEEARKAEEARRRAEEARKRLEEARKAAEEAKKAKEAAAKAAAEAKKAAEQAKLKASKPQPKPAEQRAAKAEAEEAKKRAADAATKAKAAEAKLQRAEEAVATAAKKATESMKEANAAAAQENKPKPYNDQAIQQAGATRNELVSAFDGTRRKADLERMLGVQAPTQNEIRTHLEAEASYERLAGKPENRAALEQLGIKNGQDLTAFGDRLEGQARSGEGPRAGDPAISAVQDKEALSRIIAGAAETRTEESAKKLLSNPTFSAAVAEGQTPKEAKETIEIQEALQLTERETMNLVRHTGARNAARTLVDPNAKPQDKVAALLTLGEQASNIFRPEEISARLNDVGNKVFGHLGNAKSLVSNLTTLFDPNADALKKGKAALGLAGTVKNVLGAEVLQELAPQLRKADGALRAAGAAFTLFDSNARPEDRALAALQLAGELPGVGRDLKQLKGLLAEAGVPGPDAIIGDADRLTQETLQNLPDDVKARLAPGQVADLAEAGDKVDPAVLGRALANVDDPAAIDQVLRQVKAAPSKEAAEKFLGAAAALDPKVASTALADPQLADRLNKLAQTMPLDGQTNQLTGLLKNVKSAEALRAVTGELADLDGADANKLAAALKGVDADELDKLLRNPEALGDVSKVLKNLDPKAATDFGKLIKTMDADAIATVGKFGSRVSADLLDKTLRLLTPILEKVNGRVIGEGFKLLDSLIGKMGVELTGDVAAKIFKNVAKIVPAVGSIPGLIDAGLLAKESAELHGKDKDLGYLALVGSKLNLVDSIGGLLLDATGVGMAVNLGAGAVLGIAELALDLGLHSEKAKMTAAEQQGQNYEAPGWVKAVNIAAAVATAPMGIADLVAYYGPREAFDLAKWGVEQGGKIAGKAWDLIEKAGGPFVEFAGEAVELLHGLGEAGVERLQQFANGTSEFARAAAERAVDALEDLAKAGIGAAKDALENLANAGVEFARRALGTLGDLADRAMFWR